MSFSPKVARALRCLPATLALYRAYADVSACRSWVPSTFSSFRKKWRHSPSPCFAGRSASPVYSHRTHSMASCTDIPSSMKATNACSASVVQ